MLTSHILTEVEALYDRVTIIRDGRAVKTGNLAELRHLTRTSISAELANQPDGLTQLPGVHDLKIDGTQVRFEVHIPELDAVLLRLTQPSSATGSPLRVRMYEVKRPRSSSFRFRVGYSGSSTVVCFDTCRRRCSASK